MIHQNIHVFVYHVSDPSGRLIAGTIRCSGDRNECRGRLPSPLDKHEWCRPWRGRRRKLGMVHWELNHPPAWFSVGLPSWLNIDVQGACGFILRRVHSSSRDEKINVSTNWSWLQMRTCRPAMGYSFAAGATDGPGIPPFYQGTNTLLSWPVYELLVSSLQLKKVRCCLLVTVPDTTFERLPASHHRVQFRDSAIIPSQGTIQWPCHHPITW